MKISVAQTKPIKGDIQANIENHKLLIDLAVSAGADAIFFPELSLTGYEPTLAAELATDKDDERFDVFQAISDEKKLMIGIGMPTKSDHGILISMIIFQSHQARQIYSKQYIHADEAPYFINADNVDMMTVGEMSFAICYEISIPQHAEHAYQNGSKMYIASVAKSVAGVGKAIETLRATAKKYSMTVVMSNCVGFCDNFECGGRTSVWNNEGFLIGQLNESSEGVLIMDTEKQMVIEKYLRTYVSSVTSKG